MKFICKFLIYFFCLLTLSLALASDVKADCGNGICEPGEYVLCPDECASGAVCDLQNCPQPPPANVCCRPGVSCPESNPTWTYAHDAQCVVRSADQYYTDCYWEWQYEYCSAGDKCGADSFYLYAGQCADSGCTIGGLYKTCCNGSTAVHSNCPGSAYCPGGTTTVMCGVDAGTCAILGSNCTTQPCGDAACQAIFPPVEPTATPVPGAPTNTPVPGGPVCSKWCANAGDACPASCTQISGSCSNGGLCCDCGEPTSPPVGGETRCINDPPGWSCSSDATIFGTRISSPPRVVGDTVTVDIFQCPMKGGQCQCKNNEMNAFLDNPGGEIFQRNFAPCKAVGFASGGCPDILSCSFSTAVIPATDANGSSPVVSGQESWIGKPYPPGTYKIRLYYGGHLDACSDDAYDNCMSVNFTLAEPATPTPIPTSTPTPIPTLNPANLSANCGSDGTSVTFNLGVTPRPGESFQIQVCDHDNSAYCPPYPYSPWFVMPSLSLTDYDSSWTPSTWRWNPAHWYGWWVFQKVNGVTRSQTDASNWFRCIVPVTAPINFIATRTGDNSVYLHFIDQADNEDRFNYQRRSAADLASLENASWLDLFDSFTNSPGVGNPVANVDDTAPNDKYYQWRVRAEKDPASYSSWTESNVLGPPVPTQVACQLPSKPVITFTNRTFENAVDYHWTSSVLNLNNTYESWQTWSGGQTLPVPTPCAPKNGSKTENRQSGLDQTDVFIHLKMQGKNYTTGDCNSCSTNNGTSCCFGPDTGDLQCTFCAQPSNVSWQSGASCGSFTGTLISWDDNSEVEAGFVPYRCYGGSCGSKYFDLYNSVTKGWQTTKGRRSINDCTAAYNSQVSFSMRCYTTDCGQIDGPISPTPIPCNLTCPTITSVLDELRPSGDRYNKSIDWSSSGADVTYEYLSCLGTNCTPTDPLQIDGLSYVDTNNNSGFAPDSTLTFQVRPVKDGCPEKTCDNQTNYFPKLDQITPTLSPTPTSAAPTLSPTPTPTVGPLTPTNTPAPLTPTLTPTPTPACVLCPAATSGLATEIVPTSVPQKFKVTYTWDNVWKNKTDPGNYEIYVCQANLGATCTPGYWTDFDLTPANKDNDFLSVTDNNGGLGYPTGKSIYFKIVPVKASCPALSCLTGRTDILSTLTPTPTVTLAPTPTPQSCQPQVKCDKIVYQKADGTWSEENFTIMPGHSVNLKCEVSPSGLVDPYWNWSATLPSILISSETDQTPSKNMWLSNFMETPTTGGNDWRFEYSHTPASPTVSGSYPIIANGWLLDKVKVKNSWENGTISLFSQVFDYHNPPVDNNCLQNSDKTNWLYPYFEDYNAYVNGLSNPGSNTSHDLTYDVGARNLFEPALVGDDDYILSMCAPPGSPNTYWWGESYRNYFEMYGRPNLTGTFNPNPPTQSQVTWTAPAEDKVSPGLTFTINSHPKGPCGWAWTGDTIEAEIGDYGNLAVEFYLDSISEDNKIACNDTNYPQLGVVVDGNTITNTPLTRCDPAALTNWAKLALSPERHTVENFLVGSGYKFVSWNFNGEEGTNPNPSLIIAGNRATSTLKVILQPQELPAWWQAKNGSVFAHNNLTSLISRLAVHKYLLLSDTGLNPGVAIYGNSLNLNGYDASEKNWQVKTSLLGTEMKYGFLKGKLGISTNNPLSCNNNLCSLPGESGTYALDNSQTLAEINGTLDLDKKIIIFATGDLRIKSDITVKTGGILIIVSAKNIYFAPGVKKAQGIYSADETLSIESLANPEAGVYDQAFEGQGSFVGWGGVSLNRNLGLLNNHTPAEVFIGRPDFYLFAPQEFLFTPSFFREVAP